jgi:hypothetical protein
MYAVLQVMTKNGAHDSDTSSVAVVSFSGVAVIEAVEGLFVENIGNRSVNLTWKAVAHAEGYYVMPKSMLPYPDVGKITTATNKVTGNTSLLVHDIVKVSKSNLVKGPSLTLLVRAGRSIVLRCVCEECGRPMYRPISFKPYSSRTLHRMLENYLDGCKERRT